MVQYPDPGPCGGTSGRPVTTCPNNPNSSVTLLSSTTADPKRPWWYNQKSYHMWFMWSELSSAKKRGISQEQMSQDWLIGNLGSLLILVLFGSLPNQIYWLNNEIIDGFKVWKIYSLSRGKLKKKKIKWSVRLNVQFCESSVRLNVHLYWWLYLN